MTKSTERTQKLIHIQHRFESRLPIWKRRNERFSDFRNDRKNRLLGHIIRTPNNDPLRQVTLKDDTAERPDWGKKRAGKPIQNLINEAKNIFGKT